MISKKPRTNLIYLDPSWERAFPDLEVNIDMALEMSSNLLKQDFANQEMSVVFSSDEEVQRLNKTFRHQDKPTNVLSFCSDQGDELGDVILAYETVMQEAERSDIMPLHHVLHLIVHGFLHLLGYDHEEEDDAEQMEKLEIEILKNLNIKNPYEDQ